MQLLHLLLPRELGSRYALSSCVRLSVCLPVHLSQVGVLLKRLNVDHVNSTTK